MRARGGKVVLKGILEADSKAISLPADNLKGPEILKIPAQLLRRTLPWRLSALTSERRRRNFRALGRVGLTDARPTPIHLREEHGSSSGGGDGCAMGVAKISVFVASIPPSDPGQPCRQERAWHLGGKVGEGSRHPRTPPQPSFAWHAKKNAWEGGLRGGLSLPCRPHPLPVPIQRPKGQW